MKIFTTGNNTSVLHYNNMYKYFNLCVSPYGLTHTPKECFISIACPHSKKKIQACSSVN